MLLRLCFLLLACAALSACGSMRLGAIMYCPGLNSCSFTQTPGDGPRDSGEPPAGVPAPAQLFLIPDRKPQSGV